MTQYRLRTIAAIAGVASVLSLAAGSMDRGSKDGLVLSPTQRTEDAKNATELSQERAERDAPNRSTMIDPSDPRAALDGLPAPEPISHREEAGQIAPPDASNNLHTGVDGAWNMGPENFPNPTQNRDTGGQVSNVPGVGSSSPLGGSGNSFGTFGRPIHGDSP